MTHLREVYQRLQHANMKINPVKCDFCCRQLQYLGHMVTTEGIRTDPDKVNAIQEISPPTNLKGVCRFLGMASWYRRFIPNFAQPTVALTLLLKKNVKWMWGDEQEEAFTFIKQKLTESPILSCPDFDKPFKLQTDASNDGLGAVLFQVDQDGCEKVIAYASRTLNAAEKNYSVTEKECLAEIWAIQKLRQYLEGYHFTVITDHLSLKWLRKLDNPSGRLAGWSLQLQQFDFDIEYRKASLNVVPDTLSREPLPVNNVAAIKEVACDWTIKKVRQIQEKTVTNCSQFGTDASVRVSLAACVKS